MKKYEIKVVNNGTNEIIYTEMSNKASDLTFFVEQAMENNCHIVVGEPEERDIMNIFKKLKK